MTRPNLFKLMPFVAALFVATACQSPMSPTRSAEGAEAQFAASKTTQATNLVMSPTTGVVGSPVTVLVRLMTAGHPLGGKKLTLTIDGNLTLSEMAVQTGLATFTVTGLGAGTHTAVARFAGDNGYSASSASMTFDVTP